MLDAASKNWLSHRFKESVRFDEPMRRHTWFRIGGPADAFVSPETLADLIELVKGCTQRKIPFMVVGNGSNLLVKDGGIRGVVILMDRCLNRIFQMGLKGENIRLCAQAGVKLQTLCRYAIENGLNGLLFALGIPGTVGGAIIMNAGTQKDAMASVIEAVAVLRSSGIIEELKTDRLLFSYRSLQIESENGSGPKAPEIVTSATFLLSPADRRELKTKAERLHKARQAGQPLDAKGPGCFFKNPRTGPPAGFMIDDAGLKGFRINDAVVSNRHANFILNEGNASAEDIIRLKEHIQNVVNRKYGVFLEPEVIIVGEQTK